MICDKGRLAEYDYKLHHRVMRAPTVPRHPATTLPKGFQPPHVKIGKAPRRKS